MTSTVPLVSVILPVFNGEPYLAGTIQSVLDQTYTAFELIVVNDGSKDGSGDVARAYPRVQYIEQTNAGVASARNAGIAAAAGDFVAFVDQDDLWLPRKLEAQMALMRGDPSLDCCMTLSQRFIDPMATRPAWLKPEFLDTPLFAFEPSVLLLGRRALERVGLFDPAFSQASDVDWEFRASEVRLKRAVVEEVLVLRRMHSGNSSQFVARTHAEIRRIAAASIRRRREASTS